MSARSKEHEDSSYLPLIEHGISASIEINSGDGTPKDPYHTRGWLRNDNEEAWSGVIHIEFMFAKVNPRHFLQLFMKNRNRDDCSHFVINENSNCPSYPWWMLRSDRLSHPVVLVYDTGRIYGLCASPYFIRENGHKVQWEPGTHGAFYQYGGFSCSLPQGTIGYTIGYENMPWQLKKTSLAKKGIIKSDNCFELSPGETVEFTLDLYHFDANSELEISDVIQEVYYNFRQN